MGAAYPELPAHRDAVVRVVRSEEERFDAVLTAGLPRLEEALDRAAAAGTPMSGDEAFRLYDSLGVPLDFMEDLAGQRNIAIDREGYERAMEGQRVRASAGSTFGKETDKSLAFTMTPDLERDTRADSAILSKATRQLASAVFRSSRSSTNVVTPSTSFRPVQQGMSRSQKRRSMSKPADRSPTRVALLGRMVQRRWSARHPTGAKPSPPPPGPRRRRTAPDAARS